MTPLYAARLNSFKVGARDYWPGKNQVTTADLLARAAGVEGLNAADLNYPDHFEGFTPQELSAVLGDNGLALNSVAMRYYSDDRYRRGAFMNPDPASRRAAIDMTKRAIDALATMGCDLLTIWPGQDGFDYAFQLDYRRAWDETIAAIDEVAAHAPDVKVALEYKPNEPRAFSLMPDVGTTLLALREVGRPNTGVTLDFAHVLYANEMPAHAAYLVDRHSTLLGIQLNDSYGKRDDGLIAGSAHPVQTVELLVQLARIGYDRALYFDTFPDESGLDPQEETRTNIAIISKLRAVADRLANDADLADAIARQDAALSQRIVAAALYG